jgi:hypothetical protein
MGTYCPINEFPKAAAKSWGKDRVGKPDGASKGFIKNAVIGLGLHQGMEYLLGRNLWETLSRADLALSRLYNSLGVLRRSQVYRYIICHDMERNNQVLLDFIQKIDL